MKKYSILKGNEIEDIKMNWKMTSKEALKSICSECEREMGKNKIACPFRSISNDYCEEYEKIKTDLEVLEILKKHIEINIYGTDAGDKNAIDLLIFEGDEDFNIINDYISRAKSDCC